jgi:hypothetical protein
MHKNFRIGVVRQEAVPTPGKRFAKFQMIVDLAVEDDGNFSVAAPHGLFAVRDVDYREPAVAEEDRCIFFDVKTLSIRPPMDQGLGHPFDIQAATETRETRDAAHAVRPRGRS